MKKRYPPYLLIDEAARAAFGDKRIDALQRYGSKVVGIYVYEDQKVSLSIRVKGGGTLTTNLRHYPKLLKWVRVTYGAGK